MKVKLKIAVERMPAPFLKWQCEERRTLFAALRRGEHPRFLAAHLPVVSTLTGPGATFPIHASTKGVGLLPRPDLLDEHIAEINECLARCKGRRPGDSIEERIKTTLSLYDRPERIDSGLFGGIEIFRCQTYQNLLRDSRATLLFTGPGPHYLSYQFNCVSEIVGPEDRSFEFLLGMRLLFDRERFHIQQLQYPLGYLFHIQEVFEKTPHKVCAEK